MYLVEQDNEVYLAGFENKILNNITIPEIVTKIGNHAFRGVYGYYVNFAGTSKCTTVGVSAFAEANVKYINLPYSITEIKEYAFGATPLKYLTKTLGGIVTSTNVALRTICFQNDEVPKFARVSEDSILYLQLPGVAIIVNENMVEEFKQTLVSFELQIFPVGAEYYYDIFDTYQYVISNNQAYILQYCGNGGSINIPSKLKGYPVVGLAKYSFIKSYCLMRSGDIMSEFTSLKIPNTVKYLDTSAFLDYFTFKYIYFDYDMQFYYFNDSYNNILRGTTICLPDSDKTTNYLYNLFEYYHDNINYYSIN